MEKYWIEEFLAVTGGSGMHSAMEKSINSWSDNKFSGYFGDIKN